MFLWWISKKEEAHLKFNAQYIKTFENWKKKEVDLLLFFLLFSRRFAISEEFFYFLPLKINLIFKFHRWKRSFGSDHTIFFLNIRISDRSLSHNIIGIDSPGHFNSDDFAIFFSSFIYRLSRSPHMKIKSIVIKYIDKF